MEIFDGSSDDLQRRTETKIEDRWLSVDEIGAHLGIKRDTAYKWIKEIGMPANKMGRFWKFKKAEVEEWVRQGGASDTSSDKIKNDNLD